MVFAPFDEDFGYVTLESFLAHKPVITATDAGGPLEFVEDGVERCRLRTDRTRSLGDQPLRRTAPAPRPMARRDTSVHAW